MQLHTNLAHPDASQQQLLGSNDLQRDRLQLVQPQVLSRLQYKATYNPPVLSYMHDDERGTGQKLCLCCDGHTASIAQAQNEVLDGEARKRR